MEELRNLNKEFKKLYSEHLKDVEEVCAGGTRQKSYQYVSNLLAIGHKRSADLYLFCCTLKRKFLEQRLVLKELKEQNDKDQAKINETIEFLRHFKKFKDYVENKLQADPQRVMFMAAQYMANLLDDSD